MVVILAGRRIELPRRSAKGRWSSCWAAPLLPSLSSLPSRQMYQSLLGSLLLPARCNEPWVLIARVVDNKVEKNANVGDSSLP